MSITITISPEAQNKLEKRAAVFGQDLKTFVRNVLEREAAQSLSEIAKPIYRQTAETKLNENDLENLIDETLAESSPQNASDKQMTDAVFDTVIYLQAALSDKGAAYACWRLVETGEVRVFVTQAILAEIEDVLNRPKLRNKYSILTDEKITEVLQSIRAHAVLVENIKRIYAFERDPNDEVFINLALTVDAEFLVSRDNDLLDLRKDDTFKKQFPELKILIPAEFLQVVRIK